MSNIETLTNTTKLHGATIAIDISDNFIKSAVYDEGVKTPQAVVLNENITEFIPAMIYLPKEESEQVLFGCDAVNMIDEDPEGVLCNLNQIIDDFTIEVTVKKRPPRDKQEIINAIFAYVKEQAEKYNLNGRKLSNCILVTRNDIPIHRKKILFKAIRNAGYDKINTLDRTRGITNYWLYANDQKHFSATQLLLVVDLQEKHSPVALLANNGTAFHKQESDLVETLEFGGELLSELIWEELKSNDVVSCRTKNPTNIEKISLIKTALNELIFNARAVYFYGTSLNLPTNILDAAQKAFCQRLKEALSKQFTRLLEKYPRGSIELLVTGLSSNTDGIRSVASELNNGMIFHPDKPEAIPVLGASLPDSPQWLKKQNTTAKMELASGVQFGVYSILRSLGKGGMGEVWLAQHETMDIPVAIKVVHSHLTKSSDSIDRFMAEIRNTAKLRHPNIVRAHDAGCLHGINYLVSDYVNGVSLIEKLDSVKIFPEDEVLKIGRYIADALKYAWEKHKILHRDIKPDNIMVDNDGNILLMDMGISKSLLEKPAVLTADDTLLGSPHYMSPEQIRGTDADFRSDIYSLGSTLFHLATGSQPYEGESIINVATKHLTDDVPDASERNPSLSTDFVELLKKMMSKKPENREQSWQEVIDEIDYALYGDGEHVEEGVIEEDVHEKTSVAPATILKLVFLSLLFVYAGILFINKFKEETIPVSDLGNKEAEKNIRFAIEPAESHFTIFKAGIVYNNYTRVPAKNPKIKLSPGEYSVVINCANYKPLTKRFFVNKRDKVMTFALEPYLGTINLTTFSDSKLFITNENGEKSSAGVADQNGQIRLSIPLGLYTLTIEKENYVQETVNLNIVRGKNPDITRPLKLQEGISRFESQIDYDIYQDNEMIGTTNSFLYNVNPGEYEFEFRREGYISRREKITISDKPSSPIKIEGLKETSGDIIIDTKISTPKIVAELIPKTAEIKIDDGEWKKCQIPFTIKDTKCKSYEIQLRAENFIVTPEKATIEVEHAKESRSSFSLTPVESTITITSTEKLPLYINDKKIGETNNPITLTSMINYSISAKREGYRDTVVDIGVLEPNKELKINLPKMIEIHGDLVIKLVVDKLINDKFIAPTKANITVNKKQYKNVEIPFTLENFAEKNCSIKIKAPNCEFTPEVINIEMKQDTVNSVQFTIKPIDIPLLVKSNVPEADIYNENDKVVGKTGQIIYLAPFTTQNLYVTKVGYKKHPLKFVVNKVTTETQKLTVNLIRANGPVHGEDWLIKTIDLNMKPINGGSFIMGDKNGRSDEKVEHKVNISENFWMGATTITQKQFQQVMGYNPSRIKKPDHPVVEVSWSEAVEFCKKLTELEQKKGTLLKADYIMLPTEAEWEYSCKSGGNTLFHYGNELTSNDANFDGQFSYTANHRGILRGYTTKVGSFKPNNWGLYDMHGNVWEWCRDTYSHSYKPSEQTNPQGPNVMAGDKVLRGGSWKNYPKDCRSTSRYSRPRTAKDNTIGFRVVLKTKD